MRRKGKEKSKSRMHERTHGVLKVMIRMEMGKWWKKIKISYAGLGDEL